MRTEPDVGSDREPLARLLDAAEAAVDAGVGWLTEAGDEWSKRRFKASGEEVTDADAEVERRITRVLRERTPGIPVVGEETDREDGDSVPSRCWLLDPIDGTMNFTRGAPLYAVSLGLVDGGEPALGVLHAPALDRRWSTGAGSAGGDAAEGGDAAGEGAREVSRAVIGVTGAGGVGSPSGRLLAALLDGAYRVRMQGCMSLDLIGVAEGWLDACVCVGAKPWDVAAGMALLRRRGWTVLDGDGRPYVFGAPVLVAANGPLARELAALSRARLR
ncbi:inositol monophosphatase family protein [Streptomyces verrucosisporus]|uniref:inositol monophosphatase family protein n=1 Tax=Streptomyces verrucosisporus TaxID=1695161 RepID=UPI0019D0C599|nr:inositol monophosphatase family protein [Streptomyces verrucosisporus]MBN3931698.1 inositol monophosphatase family protein [Streptomyces verrucosisporus]